MFVGNKNRINISSSRFADFIEKNNLYVDKTAFIEHIIDDPNSVVLFTRPRRMGKSLNLNTLATFLDCKQETAHLFDGLYIKSSPAFENINKYPVIYLDFMGLNSISLQDLQNSFRRLVIRIIEKHFKPEDLDYNLRNYLDDRSEKSPEILISLIESVAMHYDKKPYIIIDEYDKHILDNLTRPEGDEIKRFIITALGSTLKGNIPFEKAVLTGVTRTTKENLFSGLNNVEAYDILTPSIYDVDFSLTRDEVLELVPEDKLPGVQEWYNNMRVGNASLYNIYSIINYLQKIEAGLKGYWSRSGSEDLLAGLFNGQRAKIITRMIEESDYKFDVILDNKLNMEHLHTPGICTDTSFYTLSVQSGYLTFEPTAANSYKDTYKVFIPNKEAELVWSRLVLDSQYKGADMKLPEIFSGIHDVDTFSKQLTEFTSMVLSYHDVNEENAEWVYHVFFLGLVHSLGYKCKSNIEAGLGRFDILIEAYNFNAVIEFKVSKNSDNEPMEKGANEALRQINEKEYWHAVKDSPLPLYKIGIACHGKQCLAKAVRHL